MWEFGGRSSIDTDGSRVRRFSLPIIILLPLLPSALPQHPTPPPKKEEEEEE